MKLSMMSYTMARQPEYFGMRDMLALTRELDLDGIDFVTLHGESASELRKMVDDYGIPVVCHTFRADLNHGGVSERAAGMEEAKRGIDDAVVLGAPVIMIPPAPQPEQARKEARSNWIDGLKAVQPLAADAGLVLTTEAYPGLNSPFVLAEDLLALVHDVPGIKLTYDNGNCAAGEDPVESLRRCREHVVHAHCKDWFIRDSPASGFRQMLDGRYYKSAPIGEGDLDISASIAALMDAGYTGCINIEYDGYDMPPQEAVRRAVDCLRGIAAQAGY